jgi:hypothetical protein
MKNLMMVTAAVLLLSSAQARADFLADCIYQVSANTLRNATRNGQPVAMNYSRALQGGLDSSWRSCLKDQIEWVDSCVRIALSAPGPLARLPQTRKDVQPLVDRCERESREVARRAFKKLEADVQNGAVEPPPHPR